MLYHASATAGLKTLCPRISSHSKAWVYAIDNPVTALLFGTRKDDFDFLMDTDQQGKPILYECYPDAFRKIYQGKRCSVYELEDTDFVQGLTGWEPEWVCETEVTVQREVHVPDLYARLLEEEAQGALTVHRYANDPEYARLISGHIIDRLIRFDLVEYFDTTDERGELYYRRLIDGLKSLMDGHLLKPAVAKNESTMAITKHTIPTMNE